MEYIKKVIEATKDICLKTLHHNIQLKKKLEPNKGNKSNPLKDFYWTCFDSMENYQKKIHLKRSWILYQNKGFQPSPEKIHEFFVNERMLAGCILGEKRIDFIYDDFGKKIWIGTDPYLKHFSLLPDWMQEWNVDRNKIASDTIKGYL